MQNIDYVRASLVPSLLAGLLFAFFSYGVGMITSETVGLFWQSVRAGLVFSGGFFGLLFLLFRGMTESLSQHNEHEQPVARTPATHYRFGGGFVKRVRGVGGMFVVTSEEVIFVPNSYYARLGVRESHWSLADGIRLKRADTVFTHIQRMLLLGLGGRIILEQQDGEKHVFSVLHPDIIRSVS